MSVGWFGEFLRRTIVPVTHSGTWWILKEQGVSQALSGVESVYRFVVWFLGVTWPGKVFLRLFMVDVDIS